MYKMTWMSLGKHKCSTQYQSLRRAIITNKLDDISINEIVRQINKFGKYVTNPIGDEVVIEKEGCYGSIYQTD